jgi:uncharacterized membrane protein YidH (DUF202 family)
MDALSAFICKIISLFIQPLVILLLTAGIAYFIWGVAMYIFNADAPEERKKATQHLIWGVLGIVIMVGVMGILRIALATFDIGLPGNSC